MKKLFLTSLCGVAFVTTLFAQSRDNVEKAVRFRVQAEIQVTAHETVVPVVEKLNVARVVDYQSAAQLQELGSRPAFGWGDHAATASVH